MIFLGLSAYLWFKFYDSRKEVGTYYFPIIGVETTTTTAYLTYSIISTIVTVINILFPLFITFRFNLVLQFKYLAYFNIYNNCNEEKNITCSKTIC